MTDSDSTTRNRRDHQQDRAALTSQPQLSAPQDSSTSSPIESSSSSDNDRQRIRSSSSITTKVPSTEKQQQQEEEQKEQDDNKYHHKHFMSTIALCSSVLTFFYLLMSVFPYSGFMVMHLIHGVDHEHAGIYAGFLASSFMIGRAITSYPLGLIGDIYGRKFVLVFTSLVAGFGSLLFGLSTSYKMAFIIRFIMGKSQKRSGCVCVCVRVRVRVCVFMGACVLFPVCVCFLGM